MKRTKMHKKAIVSFALATALFAGGSIIPAAYNVAEASIGGAHVISYMELKNNSGTSKSNRSSKVVQDVTFDFKAEEAFEASLVFDNDKFARIDIPKAMAAQKLVEPAGEATVSGSATIRFNESDLVTKLINTVNSIGYEVDKVVNYLLAQGIGATININEIMTELSLLENLSTMGQLDEVKVPVTLAANGEFMYVDIEDGVALAVSQSINRILTGLENAVIAAKIEYTESPSLITGGSLNPEDDPYPIRWAQTQLDLAKEPILALIKNVKEASTAAGIGLNQIGTIKLLGDFKVSIPAKIKNPVLAGLSNENSTTEYDALFKGWVLHNNAIDVGLVLGRDKVESTVYFEAADFSKLPHIQYLIGYEDESFRPEGKLTRAEAAAIFARLLNGSTNVDYDHSDKFSDVSEDAWYSSAVSYLTDEGVIQGYSDGTFKPDLQITRAELASMAKTLAKESGSSTESTELVDVQGHWAEDILKELAAAGIIQGYEDGEYKPEREISREETATMVNRLFDRIADKKYIDENIDSLNTFEDVSKDRWSYYDVIEAANKHNHEYSVDKDGNLVETWNPSKSK